MRISFARALKSQLEWDKLSLINGHDFKLHTPDFHYVAICSADCGMVLPTSVPWQQIFRFAKE